MEAFPSSTFTQARTSRNGPPGAAVAGWRAWTINRASQITEATSADADWLGLPDDGFLAVAVYFDRTYVTGEGETRWYRVFMHSQDYYWYDATDGTYGSGPASDVPADLAAGAVKAGGLAGDEDWRAFIADAFERHEAP